MKRKLSILLASMLILTSMPTKAMEAEAVNPVIKEEKEWDKLADITEELRPEAEKLLEEAEEFSKNLRKELINEAGKAVKKTFTESVKSYFTDMANTLKSFVKGLF